MGKSMGRLILCSIAVILFSIMFSSGVSANDGETYYMKFGVPFVSFGGDFAGSTFYYIYPEGTDDIFFLEPHFGTGKGFNIVFGGARGHWGGELYLLRTRQKGPYDLGGGLTADFDSTYQEIGGNIRYYFAEYETSSVNGFLSFGMGYSRMSVENGALNTTSLVMENYTMTGVNYHFGLGFLAKIGDQFGLECEYSIGRTYYDRLKGLGYDIVPIEKQISDPEVFNLGLEYIF